MVRIHGFALVCALGFYLFPTMAHSQTIIALSPFSGGNESEAYAISRDATQVAGDAYGIFPTNSLQRHATLWAASTYSPQDLGTLGIPGGKRGVPDSVAYGVANDTSGVVVVGSTTVTGQLCVEGFEWVPSTMTSSGHVTLTTNAVAVTQTGYYAAGEQNYKDVPPGSPCIAPVKAFRLTNGALTTLGLPNPLPNDTSTASGNGVNALGVVAGVSSPSLINGYQTATIWTGTSPTSLGLLPGQVFPTTSTANAINDSNLVVGQSGSLPFYWNGTMNQLPVPTNATGVAYAVNSQGDIAGYVVTSQGSQACWWQNYNGIYGQPQILLPNPTSTWVTLLSARGISDRNGSGQVTIVGTGEYGTSGNWAYRGFVWQQ